MPVDRSTIKTRLNINPLLFENPSKFVTEHAIPVRSIKASGRGKNGSTRKLTMHVLNYKGIIVKLEQFPGYPLTRATIQFNPSVCLYAQNGRVLTLNDFISALALLVSTLNPILSDPEDWTDLVPGCKTGGCAYWHYLELPHQCSDPDGSIFRSFWNVQRSNPNTPIRHWETSIQIGNKRCHEQIAIYYKAPEMVHTGKLPEDLLCEYDDILRLETRLKGGKLVKLIGNDRNTEFIDGKLRLVRFYPSDLFQAHRASFGKLRGVYLSDGALEEGESNQGQLVAIGQLLARCVDQTVTFSYLFDRFKFYTGAKGETARKVRNYALAELSRNSSLSLDSVCSDAAYGNQRQIIVEKQEALVSFFDCEVSADPLIWRAYRPLDQPFIPLTEWPSYLCA
jgi:hypothetical protein